MIARDYASRIRQTGYRRDAKPGRDLALMRAVTAEPLDAPTGRGPVPLSPSVAGLVRP